MTQDDIFASWKQNRFVIAPTDLVDDGAIVIILSDYKFWADNAEKLDTWCSSRDAEWQGMTVVLHNEKILTEFILRWQ
jgi:hypothetical protein